MSSRHGSRIMLIDDSSDMIRAATDAFKMGGIYELVCAVSRLSEAISKLSSLPFDAVILDLNLPGVRPVSAMQQLLATGDCPVILLVDRQGCGDATIAAALGAGASAVINKVDLKSGGASYMWEELSAQLTIAIGRNSLKAASRPLPSKTKVYPKSIGNAQSSTTSASRNSPFRHSPTPRGAAFPNILQPKSPTSATPSAPTSFGSSRSPIGQPSSLRPSAAPNKSISSAPIKPRGCRGYVSPSVSAPRASLSAAEQAKLEAVMGQISMLTQKGSQPSATKGVVGQSQATNAATGVAQNQGIRTANVQVSRPVMGHAANKSNPPNYRNFAPSRAGQGRGQSGNFPGQRPAPAAGVNPGIHQNGTVSAAAQRIVSQRIIALGASTGGVESLPRVLRHLPPTTPGIVIVQHMPAGFTKLFADRLALSSGLPSREARDGEVITDGQILVAPGGKQMVVKRGDQGFVIRISDGPKVSGHRPSVDQLFLSVAKAAGTKSVAALLTGMGSDGAKGLLEIKRAGGRTIAQDEKTSVVFGMPKEAIALGAAELVRPLDIIGLSIAEFLAISPRIASSVPA